MKILITGGSGTIGKAFIKEFSDNEYVNVSRNESFLTGLMREFPDVKHRIGNIEDKDFLVRTFKEIKPDVVIHAAAMKHINIAEANPIQACNVNVVGSLNVINASILADIPVTIGISTDKACSSESVYGDTKSLMEKCFVEANTDRNRFALCRFANVAHSNGSVLPFWLKCKKDNKSIKITDPEMNRLIFSQSNASQLINKVIELCRNDGGGFVGSYKMKSVNMMEVAKMIAYKDYTSEIEVVGKRPGEKVNEDLISKDEVPFTYIHDDLILIRNQKNTDTNILSNPYSSANAEKMNKEEIEKLIWNTK